jgi:hypothetical protein
MSADHVRQRADAAAGFLVQLPEFVGRALDQLTGIRER